MTDVATSTKRPRNGRFPTISLLACLGCLAAAAALAFEPVRAHFDRAEYWTSDWRTAILADRVRDRYPRVVVVLFDSATFNGSIVSPIPRDTHAQVLRALDAMSPSVIGLDFFFVSSQGPERDGAMLRALHEIKSPIVLGAVDAHTDEFDAGQQAYQSDFLARAGREAGYLSLKYDPANIVRKTFEPVPGSPFPESFARRVALAAHAKLEGPGASSESTRIAWLLGPGFNTQPFLKVSAKEFLPGGDAARRAELARAIKGNIVLTGVGMQNADLHGTALTVWADEPMLGVMVHAHIIAQLLDGRYFYELLGAAKWLLLAAIGATGALLGWLLRGKRESLLNLTVATVFLVAVDAACYYFLRTVLPITLALYVWFIGVVFGQHLKLLANWISTAPSGGAAADALAQ
jgi:adenylate cyclase